MLEQLAGPRTDQLVDLEPVEVKFMTVSQRSSPSDESLAAKSSCRQVQSWLTKKLEVTYQIVKEQTVEPSILGHLWAKTSPETKNLTRPARPRTSRRLRSRQFLSVRVGLSIARKQRRKSLSKAAKTRRPSVAGIAIPACQAGLSGQLEPARRQEFSGDYNER
jgi:hypothetical protein